MSICSHAHIPVLFDNNNAWEIQGENWIFLKKINDKKSFHITSDVTYYFVFALRLGF
jgi:hypothetical protein